VANGRKASNVDIEASGLLDGLDRRPRAGLCGLLVAESARDAIGSADGFTWSFAGGQHLKGVKADVELYRARTAPQD
jgi:class 3 adenylate cyclase